MTHRRSPLFVCLFENLKISWLVSGKLTCVMFVLLKRYKIHTCQISVKCDGKVKVK